MELMETSLDKFYKFVYGDLQSSIPEDILGKITVAVSVLCVCECTSRCAGRCLLNFLLLIFSSFWAFLR